MVTPPPEDPNIDGLSFFMKKIHPLSGDDLQVQKDVHFFPALSDPANPQKWRVILRTNIYTSVTVVHSPETIGVRPWGFVGQLT